MELKKTCSLFSRCSSPSRGEHAELLWLNMTSLHSDLWPEHITQNISLSASFLSLSSHSWDSETAGRLHLCNGSLCLVQAGGDEEDALIEGPDHVHADLIILMYTHRLTDQIQTLFHPKKDEALRVSSISSSQMPWNEKIHLYTANTINIIKWVLAVLHNQIQI